MSEEENGRFSEDFQSEAFIERCSHLSISTDLLCAGGDNPPLFLPKTPSPQGARDNSGVSAQATFKQTRSHRTTKGNGCLDPETKRLQVRGLGTFKEG